MTKALKLATIADTDANDCAVAGTLSDTGFSISKQVFRPTEAARTASGFGTEKGAILRRVLVYRPYVNRSNERANTAFSLSVRY